jgi:hypothetical protein
MFLLYTTDSNKPKKFAANAELKEYIEIRHAESGDSDWVSEIKDDKGNSYGCSWSLEIEKF